MPDYIDHLWFGAPPAVQAAIADHPNTIVTTLDGVAYVNVRSETPLETPPGLGVVGPELARVVTGYWLGDTPDTPREITIRQFLKGATQAGIFTKEEALAAAQTGAVPAFMEAVFAQMPPDDAWSARMDWTAMYGVERSNPLLTLFGQMRGMDEAAMDAAFVEWSQL